MKTKTLLLFTAILYFFTINAKPAKAKQYSDFLNLKIENKVNTKTLEEQNTQLITNLDSLNKLTTKLEKNTRRDYVGIGLQILAILVGMFAVWYFDRRAEIKKTKKQKELFLFLLRKLCDAANEQAKQLESLKKQVEDDKNKKGYGLKFITGFNTEIILKIPFENLLEVFGKEDTQVVMNNLNYFDWYSKSLIEQSTFYTNEIRNYNDKWRNDFFNFRIFLFKDALVTIELLKRYAFPEENYTFIEQVIELIHGTVENRENDNIKFICENILQKFANQSLEKVKENKLGNISLHSFYYNLYAKSSSLIRIKTNLDNLIDNFSIILEDDIKNINENNQKISIFLQKYDKKQEEQPKISKLKKFFRFLFCS